MVLDEKWKIKQLITIEKILLIMMIMMIHPHYYIIHYFVFKDGR